MSVNNTYSKNSILTVLLDSNWKATGDNQLQSDACLEQLNIELRITGFNFS